MKGYTYAAVWHERAKSWWTGEPRPLETNCKLFRKLGNAEKFCDKFVNGEMKIYKLFEIVRLRSMK